MIDEKKLETYLKELLEAEVSQGETIREVGTYEEENILSHFEGLVVRTTDGGTFQIRIVRTSGGGK